jgi:hypothetical protein
MFDQQLDLYGQAHDIAPTHEQPRMFDFPTNLRGQVALETDPPEVEYYWAPCPDCSGKGTLREWGLEHRKVTCNRCQGHGQELIGHAHNDH